MTAPAEAAPMRDDVTPDDWEIAYEFTRSGFMGGSDGIEVLARLAARHRLAHTARPDAGDEDVERVARAIGNEMLKRNGGELDLGALEWRGCYGGNWIPFDLKRLALAAMREGVDRGVMERLREALETIANLRIANDFGFIEGPTVAGYARAALSPEQPR